MKKKVLISYLDFSSFVKKDVSLLSDDFNIDTYHFNCNKKSKLPFALIQQFLFLIWNLSKYNVLITQFAGYHSFLPALFGKIFGKKTIIIVGGTDAVSYPSINYGFFYKKPIKFFIILSYRFTSLIAPKHESLIFFLDTYYGIDYPHQGIKYFLPALKTPFKVIYNGYDQKKWSFNGTKRKNHFITVCGGWEFEFQKTLKGIDLIIGIAEKFPNSTFEVIGIPDNSKLDNLPANFIRTPYVKNEELSEKLGMAEFYLQLSISEGFPNALCEAMLCRCIPIVSNVAAMPYIVENCGFILKNRNLQLLEILIKQALKSNKEELGLKSRDRICMNFPEFKRKKELIEVVNILSI